MMTSGIVSDIYGKDGYSLKLGLSADELETIRKMIRMQWLYRLQLLVPNDIQKFDEIGIERYHELAHLINHSQSWLKPARVLPRKAIDMIRKMTFFNQLRHELGQFSISDEECFGWENIYWRLVRPGNTDFGSLHTDKWFWDLDGYGASVDFPHERLKIWIAIYTVCGKNGLRIVPGSHQKKDWKWHAEMQNGFKKPILDESEDNLDIMILPMSSGEIVVFHDELIHGGAPNTAETTRISIEFTILIPIHVANKLKANLG